MNIKKIIGLSEWLTFTLADSDIFDPPVIRLRLRFIDPFAGHDSKDRSQNSGIIKALILDAIAAWDLCDEEGKPVPCTSEVKAPDSRLRLTLEALLGSRLEGNTVDEPRLLGSAVLQYATHRENFLGN